VSLGLWIVLTTKVADGWGAVVRALPLVAGLLLVAIASLDADDLVEVFDGSELGGLRASGRVVLVGLLALVAAGNVIGLWMWRSIASERARQRRRVGSIVICFVAALALWFVWGAVFSSELGPDSFAVKAIRRTNELRWIIVLGVLPAAVLAYEYVRSAGRKSRRSRELQRRRDSVRDLESAVPTRAPEIDLRDPTPPLAQVASRKSSTSTSLAAASASSSASGTSHLP
jgi:hypothetical protein